MDNVKIPVADPPASDSRSSEEEKIIGAGDLESTKKKNKHNQLRRKDKVLGMLFFCFSVLTGAIVFITLCAIISLAWHYMMPQQYQWLTGEQISFIKSVLLSGVSGALVAKTMDRYLSNTT